MSNVHIAINMSATDVLIAVFSVFVFSYLYSSNNKFKYYFKYCVYFTICIVVSIILIPVAIFRPKNVTNFLLLSRICQNISPLIGVEWTIKGTEHISHDRSYIVMANHQSSLDVLGMFHIWPLLKKCTVVMKEELFHAGPFGILLWLCGGLFIPRSQGEKSKEILNEALKTIKSENIKLWIFPEGTRSGGSFLAFKKGGFHMAISAQIPILPIVFSQYDFINYKGKQFNSGKVVINILPPISTEGKSLKDIDELMKETKDKMLELYK